jgi:hypothetical protein
MNRSLGLLLLAALLIAPLNAGAQVPVPTPTFNAQGYDDLGMHFAAPPQFHALFQRKPVKVAELQDDPIMVAGWTTYAQHPHRLLIAQAHFAGNLDGWDATYTQTLRNQGEGTLLKNRQSITLKNGMPARYLELTTGTGFDVSKGYIVMWADGQRGVALILTSLVGELDEKAAKEILLGDASAVRYPLYREQDGP